MSGAKFTKIGHSSCRIEAMETNRHKEAVGFDLVAENLRDVFVGVPVTQIAQVSVCFDVFWRADKVITS